MPNLATDLVTPEATDILSAARPIGGLQTRQIEFLVSELPGGGGGGPGSAFTPSTPANWPAVPATIQQALDTLAVGGVGGVVQLASGPSVNLDFNSPIQDLNTIDENVTFTTSNRAPARSIALRIVAGADITLTFPGTWKFLGTTGPTGILNGETGRLTIESWGTTDANVIAAYALEA